MKLKNRMIIFRNEDGTMIDEERMRQLYREIVDGHSIIMSLSDNIYIQMVDFSDEDSQIIMTTVSKHGLKVETNDTEKTTW